MRRAAPAPAHPDAVVLQYAVHNHDGRWRLDIVVGDGFYAERRTHLESGRSYAFGEDQNGPWLKVGDGPGRIAEAPWRRETRTRAALFGMRFLRPEAAEEAFYMQGADTTWEYVYRPRGGHTLTLIVDEESGRVVSWDHLDAFGRLTICDDVRWTRRGGRDVPAEASCSAINGAGDTAVASWMQIEASRRDPVAPEWARADPARSGAPCVTRPIVMAMTSELSVALPVQSPGSEPVPFVLDSGAWHTTVDERVAERLGIVPTGEVPIYQEPPWLPSGTSWIGVADRMTVAGVHLDGARVLVMPGLSEAAGAGGLVGADFFRRFVVDVDTPQRTLRLVPHELFRRPRDSTAFFARGMSREMRIQGEVRGVDRGQLILDTGASINLVVSSPAMAAARPRHRGSSIGSWFGDETLSPDYVTDVDGLRLGPFDFPAMPAWGRDRERDRIGGGIGLLGMGTMRHLRMIFDFRNRTVYASAGPGYQALIRSGMTLEDADGGAGGALVSRVVPGSRAWGRGVRAGDVLLRVDGISVRGALDGREALAAHVGAQARLDFLRRDLPRRVVVALAGPAETVDPLRQGDGARAARGRVTCPQDERSAESGAHR